MWMAFGMHWSIGLVQMGACHRKECALQWFYLGVSSPLKHCVGVPMQGMGWVCGLEEGVRVRCMACSAYTWE